MSTESDLLLRGWSSNADPDFIAEALAILEARGVCLPPDLDPATPRISQGDFSPHRALAGPRRGARRPFRLKSGPH